MKHNCGIYKITSPSGKIYVGQSVDVEKREKKYGGLHCVYQRKLFNSIKKYGWDKHKFEIICYCKKSELDTLERKYIAEHNSFNSTNGLNLREGGNGKSKMSDETKDRIRFANLGKKQSSETILKRTKKTKGKQRTELTKQKMRDVHKSENYSKLTEAQVLAIRMLSGKYSQTKLAEIYKVNQSTIHLILTNKTWKQQK